MTPILWFTTGLLLGIGLGIWFMLDRPEEESPEPPFEVGEMVVYDVPVDNCKVCNKSLRFTDSILWGWWHRRGWPLCSVVCLREFETRRSRAEHGNNT